jgi:glycosyltransferase involved in cell wall biosynthesis
VIYSRQSYITLAAPALARANGVPLVTEVNGIQSDDLEKRGVGPLRKWVNRMCERYAYRRSAAIVAVSSLVRDHLRDACGVPEELVEVIMNGVNTDHFGPGDAEAREKARSELGVADDEFCVGYVGCFTPFDGVELLPEVARRLGADGKRRFRFVMIGEERKKGAVERLIDDLGVSDRFVLTGRIDYGDLPRRMAAFDIGVAPYITKGSGPEKGHIGNTSLKCLEYSAAGLPVVTTRMPQLDYVGKERCGSLVEAGDVSALVAAIASLAETARAELKGMGRRGRDYVRRERTWRAAALRTQNVLQSLSPSSRTAKR